jgi:hypothetical protein
MTDTLDTVAGRVRARKNPAIMAPPPAPVGNRTDTLRNLHLTCAGQTYAIADNIDGDTPWEMGFDQAAQVTIPIRSPDESLLAVLTDEALLQEQGVRISVNSIDYVLVSVNSDDGWLYTLIFEDETAWRLRQFSSFLAKSRATYTRALFILRLVNEASRPPYEPMAAFIPELGDKQRILAADTTTA